MKSQVFETDQKKFNQADTKSERTFHRPTKQRIPACKAAVDHRKSEIFGSEEADKT